MNHLEHLGLKRNPFPPTPDASCYFYTGQLEREFAEIMHCVQTGKGFVLLTGEVGLGKSTLVRRLLDAMEPRGVTAALVFNTFLQGRELLSAINRDFGLSAQGDLAADMATLNAFLVEQAKQGKASLLVIDDAQNLTPESLELVRLLCNLETGQAKLLQIILAGQPELLDTLSQPDLRQLKSRIVKHVHLSNLDKNDIGRYFEFRVTEAGGMGRLSIDPAAEKLLFEITQGNPRCIHLILDRCLYGLVALRSKVVTKTLVKAAVEDVGFPIQTAPRRHRHQMLVGLLLLSIASAVGWHTWKSSVTAKRPNLSLTNPLPVATAPVATQVAEKHPDHDGAEACIRLLETATAEKQAEIKILRLPENLGKSIPPNDSTCLYKKQQEIWVVWRPVLRQPEMLDKQPNDAIRVLQSKLSNLGLLDTTAVDGRMGPTTRQSLARFQLLHGIPADGEPNDLTLLLLEKTDVKPPHLPVQG